MKIINIYKLNSFDNIIIFAIKYKKSKILDLLKKIPDYNLLLDLRRIYPKIKFDDSIKMAKLCIKLKNYTFD